MTKYDKLARFYDEITGDQLQSSKFIHKLIKQQSPSARTLLDVACGTGSHLFYLSKFYKVSGLDISSEMLSVAQNKVSGIPLFQNDMTRFNFGQTYDVIICMNDSINHLLKKSFWGKLFKNIHKHLNQDGLFIFNLNTISNLKRLAHSPPTVHQFNNNYLITYVRPKKNNIYEWDLRLFEKQIENNYFLHECMLHQISFSHGEIRKLLIKLFKKIYIFDFNQQKATSKCERSYCMAIK